MAIEAYVKYYNEQRIHSVLDYQTPSQVAAASILRAAVYNCRASMGAVRKCRRGLGNG